MSQQSAVNSTIVSGEETARVNSGVIPPPSAAGSADHDGDTVMTPLCSEDGAFDSEEVSSGSDAGCSGYEGANSPRIYLGNSEVRVNNNLVVTVEMLLASAEEDLNTKKGNYYAALGHYLGVSKRDPTSTTAKSASKGAKEAQVLFAEAEQILKDLKASTAPASKPHDKRSTLVPSNLPFLQLRSEGPLVKANRDVFDLVYDFCQEFTTVLEAHSLSLDSCWERLLPTCLNKEERSWFENKLKGKAYNWKKAESILLDHYDMPFRKFLNMGRVWCMKQGKGESARSFGAKFQKFRRQASLDDGVQLVLCFWWNLRPEVQEACLIPLSANYGTKMPSKIEDIISLVSVSTSDSTALLHNPANSTAASSWSSFAAHNGASSLSAGSHKGKKRFFSLERGSQSPKKSWDFKKAMKDGICFSCKAPWVKRHSCLERKKYLTKVSRMAVCSSAGRPARTSTVVEGSPSLSWSEYQDNTSALAKMALDCKYNLKDMVIKRDFKNMSTNITFPILANNSIRTISLLDCGATFSSVDKNFCLKNGIAISYINHINKDLLNKNNVHKYFICLADSNTQIKRIGTCVISVTCNSKTIQREFEVMNLTNSHEYDFSIGTDYMSSLGIGIYGLPLSYDDADSSEERREADRRFNNKSPKQFEDAMDYIRPFIKVNQDIPKGSFCTIPESVVCLDTPENAMAFRSPYPIPYKMQGVVDEQVKEWLDNGTCLVLEYWSYKNVKNHFNYKKGE
ncbi:hypothetical protein PHYBLDRAFT_173289 [Phycomyces blakesleeanus NRRL 1555(-)]|uniref:Uncharacterized protein n=1 Tax=Phycomyces blakesleeanus (strain ATCC 8743b / DSM 1359 / FGSC 10004 / NBRC 33097 / NRRL 1555) TaxID=763407 RepID=A0A162TMC0_PHYB8|nr:hypothetical protein PHYBLDRAFT_173289 [Phycomyces blakesleeanus NRRL 1555(-)]OAD68283.1 hypothetical protein PHYBLDRAFT_173289 [Phycomyces blakesleeanus NRRL 1555(-)]|eukprot:XP_018286323.1 hypothetical protein PHYBLDRAFT_173289 [Phycomyces blakesleeanus NRRL 1555(-)]